MKLHWRLVGVVGLVGLVLLGGCERRGAQAPDVGRPAAPVPAGAAEGVVVERSIGVDGVDRGYRLFVPAGEAAVPRALVVNLHGYNSDAVQQEQVSGMSRLAAVEGFVVAYPQGMGDPASWRFGERAAGEADVAFIRTLVAEVRGRYSIDPRRIYVTGISNGAEMAYHLACAMPDTFAAFATVAGGYPPLAQCGAKRPIPAVAFHGTADRILAYEGKPPLLLPVETWAADWAQHNGCAAAPEVSAQGAEVVEHRWQGCEGAAEVVLYTIEGKGHSWPGSVMPAAITTREIDATTVIWAFFAAHPMP